jgi:Polysaccharide lyase
VTGRRIAAWLTAGVASIALAACHGETDQATNVTSDSADLHAHASVPESQYGTYYFQYRVAPTGAWEPTPVKTWGSSSEPCDLSKPEVERSATETVDGLDPNTVYDYRLVAKFCGDEAPTIVDSNGPEDGDPPYEFDNFHTGHVGFAGLPFSSGTIAAADYATTASPNPWKLITDGFYYGTLSGSDRCGGSAWNDTTDVQVNRSAMGGDPNPAFDALVHTGYRTLHSGDGTGGFGPQSRYDYLPGSQDPDCDNQPDSTRAQLGGFGALDSFYRAPVGTRTLFGFSVRLENPARVNKILSTGGGNTKFSQIVQVKSTDPGTSGGPLLSMLEGTNGVKLVYNSQTDPQILNENLICSTCAAPGNVTVPRGVWLRFALDVDWETSSSGAYRLWGDLDGDAVRDFVALTPKINEQTVKSGFSYATPNLGPYHKVCTGSCDSSDTSGLPTNGRDYANVEILEHAVSDSWGP